MHDRFPLSLDYILFCIYRVMTRPSHETLAGVPQSIEIIGNFANMFKGYTDTDMEVKWGGQVGGQIKQPLEYIGKGQWRNLREWWENGGYKNCTF